MELLSPGVYPIEVDFSAYVQAASTSTFGVVGVFEKGPVGEATLVTSLDDAKNKFGGYVDGHFGMLALKSFFENGGSRAQVVRVVHYNTGAPTSSKATVSIVDRDGATPKATLQVDAIHDGAWGNGLAAQVVASVAYPSTGFTLVIKQNGAVVETHADLLIGEANAGHADYAERRVNDVSLLVRVTDLASTTAAPANLPKVSATAAGEALASGGDGLTGILPSDFIGDVVTGAPGLTAFDGIDVNFIAIPGESTAATGQGLGAGLITYAEGRKDCVAIIEAPVTATVANLADFRMGTGSFSATGSAFNSSYGALYGPWLNGTHPVTGRDIKLPPSGFVAGIFARSDAAAGVWAAPAGLNRATVAGAKGAALKLSQGELETLYQKQVNAIAVVVGALVVYGQKTLQLKASATDRVNVRRTLAFTEKSVKDAAQFLVFEPNSPKTWQAFIRLVSPFLREIKNGGGFEDFRVVCDATINTPDVVNQNIMKARIQVKPTKTAEFITVEFAIAPSGASFDEL